MFFFFLAFNPQCLQNSGTVIWAIVGSSSFSIGRTRPNFLCQKLLCEVQLSKPELWSMHHFALDFSSSPPWRWSQNASCWHPVYFANSMAFSRLRDVMNTHVRVKSERTSCSDIPQPPCRWKNLALRESMTWIFDRCRDSFQCVCLHFLPSF